MTSGPLSPGAQQRRIDGDLVATVRVDPGIFRPAFVEVRLADPSGRPVADARRVDVAFAMRGMNHGPRGATAVPIAPGAYAVSARLLLMTGPTALALRVERADGRLQSALFDLDVPPDRSGAATGLLADRPTDPVQVVDVQVDPSGVVPDHVSVRAGHPVRLEIIYLDRPPCGPSVQVGADGTHTDVSPDGLAELTLTPDRTADLPLTCHPDALHVG